MVPSPPTPVFCDINPREHPQKWVEKTISLGVSCTFLFYSDNQELVLLADMRMHNLHRISFLPLMMCNRKIVDMITAMQNN